MAQRFSVGAGGNSGYADFITGEYRGEHVDGFASVEKQAGDNIADVESHLLDRAVVFDRVGVLRDTAVGGDDSVVSVGGDRLGYLGD